MHRSQPEHSRVPQLLPGDRLAAGSLLALGMLILGATQYYPAANRSPTIDIDRATPVPIEFQVDINQADAIEFILLPEVGEALAERIVEERTANGPFRNHGDLRRVRGIGVKTLDRLRPYLLPMAEPEAIAGQ